MTGFAEPSTEQKTAALERDFENRAFVADFSQSVQQLAIFVSNFGMLPFTFTYPDYSCYDLRVNLLLCC